MASYNIVLNLRGNASKRVKKLADDLERARDAAGELRDNLSGVRAPRGGGSQGGGGPRGGGSRSVGGSVSLETTFSSSSGLGSVARFAGKLGVAGAIVSAALTLAKAIAQVVARSTALAYTGGYSLLKTGVNTLTGSGMAEGVRYLQRQEQARRSLGANYQEAFSRAEGLAMSYGLNPATALSNISVLTGMRVGSSRLTQAHAERLTLAGGLISQQSGLAFETVMTNIQQMMAVQTPSLRDIRQLLTHAPILGRYALDEMEERGVSAEDGLKYLRDNKDVLLSVLDRYIEENPSLGAMRARGEVQMANTGFFAELAKSPEWVSIGAKYSNLVGAASGAVVALIEALNKSEAVNTSIYQLTNFFKQLPTLLDSLMPYLDGILMWLHKLLAIDIEGPFGLLSRFTGAEGTKQPAKDRAFQMKELRAALEDYVSRELTDDAAGEAKRKELAKTWVNKSTATNAELVQAWLAHYEKNPQALNEVVKLHNAIGSQIQDPSLFNYAFTPASAGLAATMRAWINPVIVIQRALGLYKGKPTGWHNEHTISGSVNQDAIIPLRPETSDSSQESTDSDLLRLINGGGGAGGSGISGFGADRKSLTINFQAPIVQWESTIQTDNPSDVVEEVSNTIEAAATRAIQIAIFGATTKMNTAI